MRREMRKVRGGHQREGGKKYQWKEAKNEKQEEKENTKVKTREEQEDDVTR